MISDGGEIAWGYLSTAVLLATRFGVAVRLTPFLGGRPLPLMAALGIACALSLMIAPLCVAAAVPAGGWQWLGALAGEAAIGAILGVMARLVFFALESAADLTSIAARIFPSSELRAPVEGASPVSALYTIFGTAAFILMGGHRAMIEVLAASTRFAPPGGGAFPGDSLSSLPELALGVFQSAFAFGVMISAPVFVAGLFAHLFAGLVTRLFPWASQAAGAQTLQTIAVQLVLLVILGAAVSAGVAFLEGGMADLKGALM